MLPGFNNVDKDGSALQEWTLCEAPPLMHQDVEGVVDDARLRGAKVLQEMEVRPAVGAEGYQFSVDHRVVGKMLQGRRDVREPLVEHILPARIERRGAAGPIPSSR